MNEPGSGFGRRADGKAWVPGWIVRGAQLGLLAAIAVLMFELIEGTMAPRVAVLVLAIAASASWLWRVTGK
jgi:hypothetical protein